MTINRTSVKPNYYIEIDDIDVSEYIIHTGKISPNSKDKISSGMFELDKNVDDLVVPKRIKHTVYFYVEYDSKYKRFGGVISKIREDKSSNKYQITIKSFAWLTYQTRFTGIFRDDASKGNRKTIITDILTEKFPNITWDASSFPAISSDYDILYKDYNNKKPGDIFDELVYPLDRDWWIDKTGKFFCKEREYTQYNRPVTINVNTTSYPVIDLNTNYANMVLVFGKKFEKINKHTFSGTGAADEFTLDFYPIGSADVEYSDGTLITVTMEGNEDYDDSGVYDAYFKQSEKKLKFNANTSSGTNNIIVKTKVFDQIREEVASASEIARLDYEVVREIHNEDISTQDEAFIIGDNYLVNYGKDQYLFYVPVAVTNDSDLAAWAAGNSVPLCLDGSTSSYENIVEENWVFNPDSGLELELRFVDFARTGTDVLQDLIKKIAVQEQKVASGSTNLTRFFYMGSNAVVSFQNLSVKTQDTNYIFELQENPGLQDDRSLMSETGSVPGGGVGDGNAAVMTEAGYSDALEIEFSINSMNKFVLSFLDNWFEDESATTADFDKTNKKITFADGEIFQTLKIFGDKSKTITKATLTKTSTGGLNFVLSANGGNNWEAVTAGTEHTFTNTGEDLRAKATAVSAAEITELAVSHIAD